MFFRLYCVTLTTHAFHQDINEFNVVSTSKWYENVKMTKLTQVVPFCIFGHIYIYVIYIYMSCCYYN